MNRAVLSERLDATGAAVTDASWVSVTGQIVVEMAIVLVVRYVVLDLAGQFWTEEGHAVIVAVTVEKIVDVVDFGDVDGWEDWISVAPVVDLEGGRILAGVDDADEPEADGLRPLGSTDGDGKITAEELRGNLLTPPVGTFTAEPEADTGLEDGDPEELKEGSPLAPLVGIAGLAAGNTVEDSDGDDLAGVRTGLLETTEDDADTDGVFDLIDVPTGFLAEELDAEKEDEDNGSADDLLGLTAGVLADGLEKAIGVEDGDGDTLLEEIERGMRLETSIEDGVGVGVDDVVQQTSVVSSMLSTSNSKLPIAYGYSHNP